MTLYRSQPLVSIGFYQNHRAATRQSCQRLLRIPEQ
jgi:hypothetical protein